MPTPTPPGTPVGTPAGSWSLQPLSAATLAGARELMRTCVARDLGDAHDPVVHADVDDPLGRYPGTAEAFLLVAVDDATGAVVGTAGLRGGRLRPGATPQHLVERYADGRTGQLVRVYVAAGARRRGIARALVAAVRERAAGQGRYERLALHAYRHSPGAVAFWGSLGARVVADDTAGATRSVFYEFAAVGAPGGTARASTASPAAETSGSSASSTQGATAPGSSSAPAPAEPSSTASPPPEASTP